MKVTLKHNISGLTERTKVGVSWTTLFFGIFPAIFRGDWKWAGIMFILALLTFGFSGFVFMFIYNKLYIKELLMKGFAPSDEASTHILQRKGLIA